ncbi:MULTISPECIES: sugar phosphate nucleotidyltransferase [Kamptonema]|uniref:sugar phosphate nucleotidyltransferase n=1 Tax=Kamptonema TaxID=1501433 RepID=UPI0001DACF80|nr:MULTISPECIES: sugar phosphate nucleotidyltransferase [Kamptonema]CBN58209.1 GHMP kinases putative ATP-binding protein (modular protein) [Kamptonema sp. PCC 6506]
MKIFVPGRLCLFGEHSDWAGGYRHVNPALEKGYTLIASTNQGIYAEVKPNSTELIIKTTLNDSTKLDEIALSMDRASLLAEAEKGGFFSYAAGVAYQFLTHYRVEGLEIDNYLTDLPIKKGLSSSAVICVLVARAFNRLYDLKMTVRGEMEMAYQGEILTPSRCGRMDQGCAYGNRPILMIFDGTRMEVNEVKVPKDLFFVIVDLAASKNTQEILGSLNNCYPLAVNQVQKDVQEYLGSISSKITLDAVAALQDGEAEKIGELMKISQSEFDRCLIPACPQQLTAPVLHELLNYSAIQPYILGGKGVGSQGDGTAQFIVKNEESQQRVIDIIERDFPQMQCLKLTIPSQSRVRKAVIPAAGFGTRMFPCTKVVKKELFPIIDRDGRAKPVILAIVEEAISAGIEEVGIVVQPGDREIFEDLFKKPPKPELLQKLSPQNQEYSKYLEDLGERITILTQDSQDGFGHAVFCAKEWVNDEPFLLLLGDHIYASESESCARQLLDIYSQVQQSVVGLRITPSEMIHHYGCATGVWQKEGSILSVTQFYEKPKIEYAQQYLHIKGMADELFLSIFGMYVLQPKIFDYLAAHINQNFREGGEFQLTSCLEKLRQEEGIAGYIVKGKCFDTGLPDVYRQTLIDFPNSGQ